MRVEDIGGQNRSFVPGASSLVIEGMPGVTNTSHLRATSPALVSVSDMSDFLCDAVSADHDQSNSMPTRIPTTRGIGIDFLLTESEKVPEFWNLLRFCHSTFFFKPCFQ